MRAYIIDTLTGIFAVDENTGSLLNYRDFNGEPEEIIEFYSTLDEGTLGEGYIQLLKELKNSGFNEFIFDNESLESITSERLEETTSLEESSLEFKNFRFNLIQKLRNIGLKTSEQQLLQKYKKVNDQLIRQKIKEAGEKKDKRVIQIIETLDFVKSTISKFSNRLKEWYGLHFPEITDKFIEEEVLLAKLVFEIGHRKNYTRSKLTSRFSFDKGEVDLILELASKSMGANIDLEMVQRFAEEIVSLDGYRETLEERLDDLMEQLAPNIKAIIGSLVGAKLIAEAGSLRKLAFMPSSRIQLLGAEKALYRHLRTGSKLPKHGIIFQWKQIRGNPSWIRGNIARLIAGKVGLAAKIDYFSGDFIGDKYAQEIEEKIEKLKKEHPHPPEN